MARKQPIVPFLEEILQEAKQQIEFALELKMFQKEHFSREAKDHLILNGPWHESV